MSCCNSCTTPPTSGAGKKISELNNLQEVAYDDILVIVDASSGETKNISYEDLVTFETSATSLSGSTFPDAIVEISNELETHVDDVTIHFPMSSIQGLSPSAGLTGDVLAKTSDNDYDYEWIDL